MKYIRYVAALSIIMLGMILGGCSRDDTTRKIKIATNEWIGYTPLFLAKKQGSLKRLDIELIHNVSLAEAMEVFAIGKADMVTTTQHEYFALRQTTQIVPVILIDRSNGGDMVLSNKPVRKLQKAPQIDVYLEIDSINVELYKTFAKRYDLNDSRVVFHNQDQQRIKNVENDPDKAIVIVTYSPYDVVLRKKGFFVVASTKNMDELVVVDALCARRDILQNERKRLKKLKKILDETIRQIQADPKAAYKEVKSYLGNISYEEFEQSLRLIKWVNDAPQHLVEVLQKMGYETKEILR